MYVLLKFLEYVDLVTHVFVTECVYNDTNQTWTDSLQLFSDARTPQGAFKNHSRKATIVFIFPHEVTELSACSIQDSQIPLSCFAKNASKPPTEAESQTPKNGLTHWTLDLTVKQLSDSMCSPSCTGESIIEKVHEQRGQCVFFQRFNQVRNLRITD